MILFKEKGHTILEMAMVAAVFSLFLVFMYATFDMGLKSWQIGSIRSELQQSAEVAIKRIIKDLTCTNMSSLVIGPSGEYIAFESPISITTRDFVYDPNNGLPEWQGHIIYFTLPSDKDGIVLYRKYINRGAGKANINPLSLPSPINTSTYLVADDDARVMARNLKSINFNKYGSNITVTIKYIKDIRKNASVNFSAQGKGIEEFELISSVIPKN